MKAGSTRRACKEGLTCAPAKRAGQGPSQEVINRKNKTDSGHRNTKIQYIIIISITITRRVGRPREQWLHHTNALLYSVNGQ